MMRNHFSIKVQLWKCKTIDGLHNFLFKTKSLLSPIRGKIYPYNLETLGEEKNINEETTTEFQPLKC